MSDDDINAGNKRWKMKFTDDVAEAQVLIVKNAVKEDDVMLASKSYLMVRVLLSNKTFLSPHANTGPTIQLLPYIKMRKQRAMSDGFMSKYGELAGMVKTYIAPSTSKPKSVDVSDAVKPDAHLNKVKARCATNRGSEFVSLTTKDGNTQSKGVKNLANVKNASINFLAL